MREKKIKGEWILRNREKLEQISEFLKLADKHNLEVNVSLNIYGNKSKDMIKDTKALYKGRFKKKYQASKDYKWIRFYDASKGKDYCDSDFRIVIFYPTH